ncbi:Ankyrin-2 [Stylophora pistillata]|uniref:Ankyrin-2 n=1 Tax=Stylophora pistillata TaxID=50429 RepID=A0A2B4R6N5_STYPI|nr:Ankyrin-2 [Stylophora pistillata]
MDDTECKAEFRLRKADISVLAGALDIPETLTHKQGYVIDDIEVPRPICRPGEMQRIVYNGYKRVHGLKFQSVVLPNGIIANLFGPVGNSVDSKDATGRTPLMIAAGNGNVQAVKGLIKRGAGPSFMDNHGWRSLHFAAAGADTNMIDLILTHASDIESKAANGASPRISAVCNGKVQGVKYLLERGANPLTKDNDDLGSLYHASSRRSDVLGLVLSHVANGFSVDSKDEMGRTPLINLVLNGNIQAVKGLIKRGADPSLMDNHGWSLLHFAAYCGDPHVINLILTHVPGIESKAANGATPLLIAVCHGKLQGVKYLLERGANPLTKNNNGQDALFFASSRGSDVLDLLLSHVANGFSVDSKDAMGRTPLTIATGNGNVQAVNGLIKRGADPSLMNNHGWSTLHFAAHCGDPHMIDLMLTHVPDIESEVANSATPLIIGVCHGKLQGVKYLLERGANPLTKDRHGRDSLSHASSRGSDVLDLLLSHIANGFSVDSRDETGRTPLMNAALNSNVQAMKSLIKRGADPSLMSHDGWNSLHFAAKNGDPDIIDLILTHVPDIESKTADGTTPLIIAVRFGKLQGVKYLLERGANPLSKDNCGRDFLSDASSRGSEVLDLLLSHVDNGFSVDSKDAMGRTPLIIAVRCGKLQGVKHLLERGANPLSKDNDGQDSLYLASSRCSDVLDLLLSHVANKHIHVHKSCVGHLGL